MYNAMVKTRNKKGFTLMEMLIVVAIIAILVAVSVPVFTSQLNNAKIQTDAANERSAKAVAVATYLTDGEADTYYYNAATGTLATVKDGIAAYGQNETGIVQVVVSSAGIATTSWVAAA